MKHILLITSLFILTSCSGGMSDSKNISSNDEVSTTRSLNKSIDDCENVSPIQSSEEADDLLKTKGVVYIYVSQEGCQYCEKVKPALEDAISQASDTKIYHVNATNIQMSELFKQTIQATKTPWLVRLVDGKFDSYYLFDEYTKGHDISLWLLDI